MWDSKYQQWNSTRLGPKRDFMREREKAARDADMRFGITFHHEYSWWWQTAFQSANNALGTACVAAFTAAMRIKMFVMCPLDALGMAMATYTGQNYGAGKPDRILSGVKSATLVMVEYSVVIAAVMWALADKFALLFISPAETEIMKDTVLFLHINTSSFILLGSLSILRYTIQGAGYTRLSIFSGVSEMIARVLVSLYLVPALKFVGVCLGDPTAWLFANLFLIPAFVYVYHQLKGRMSINGVPANA